MSAAQLRRPGSIGASLANEKSSDDSGTTSTRPLHANSNVTGYAIFTKAILSGLVAIKFDPTSGAVLSQKTITGPFAKYYELYYGDSTRVIEWDEQKAKFYFADLSESADSEAVTVYSIDPETGESTSAPVSGCKSEYPIGLSWDAQTGLLILATQSASTASFCAVDPASGKGSAMGQVMRGTTEANESYYAAFLSHVHGGVAIRVGYREVTTGGSLGKVATTLARGSGTLTPSWHAVDLDTHGAPASVHTHPSGGYISLAPRTSSGSGYDVVGWDTSDDGGQRLLANLTNAHPPRIPFTNAPLGYVAAAVSGKVFGSLTVAYHPGVVPGGSDKWVVSTLDLSTGKLTEAALSPQPSIEGADTASLTGFGLVAPSVRTDTNRGT